MAVFKEFNISYASKQSTGGCAAALLPPKLKIRFSLVTDVLLQCFFSFSAAIKANVFSISHDRFFSAVRRITKTLRLLLVRDLRPPESKGLPSAAPETARLALIPVSREQKTPASPAPTLLLSFIPPSDKFNDQKLIIHQFTVKNSPRLSLNRAQLNLSGKRRRSSPACWVQDGPAGGSGTPDPAWSSVPALRSDRRSGAGTAQSFQQNPFNRHKHPPASEPGAARRIWIRIQHRDRGRDRQHPLASFITPLLTREIKGVAEQRNLFLSKSFSVVKNMFLMCLFVCFNPGSDSVFRRLTTAELRVCLHA